MCRTGPFTQNWSVYTEPYRPSRKNGRTLTSVISVNFVLDHNNSIFVKAALRAHLFAVQVACIVRWSLPYLHLMPHTHTHTHTHTHARTHTHRYLHNCVASHSFSTHYCPIHLLETVVVNKFPLLPLPILLD